MNRLMHVLLLIAIGTHLVACKPNHSEEVFRYDAKPDVYANFIKDPEILQKQLVENDQPYIRELLHGILLSKEPPSQSAINAFSQFFAEANNQSINAHLSQAENAHYANRLGAIIGNLMSLRRHIVARRDKYFFSWWSDYQALDKRWLGLFTDIAPSVVAKELPDNVIKIARTCDVNGFAEALLQSGYATRHQDKDLVDTLIDTVADAISANFNGYEEDTERRVGNDFDFSFVDAYDHAMKGLKRN
jgi:hypothetical protein